MLREDLGDPEFRKEYESFEGEFPLSKEVMMLRKARNLSQNQLAEIAETAQPVIARLESGRYSNVSLSFLKKIGKALDVVPEIYFTKVH